MKKVRICKACGGEFEWEPKFRRPHDYCEKCRRGAKTDRSIKVQSMIRGLPNGKYIVMKCEHGVMIGNVFNRTKLTYAAYDGYWPEGMMVFNVNTRKVYEIKGKEHTNQKILLVLDPPETVKRRIKSSFPK